MNGLIVIEGIDGAGKGTLAAAFCARAEAAGVSIAALSFPRYGETRFARLIAAYLNGEYGELSEADPRFVALLYAGDRMESAERLAALRAEHDVVLLDRYVASNAAYQAAKLPSERREDFIRWIFETEFEVFGLPRPRASLWLDADPALADARVGRKGARDYTQKARDLHENADGYMATVRAVYAQLASAALDCPWHRLDARDATGAPASPDDLAAQAWTVLSV